MFFRLPRTAKDRSEKKLLGFSFVHLMEADETTIKDGSHSLCVYKCEDAEELGRDPSLYLALASRLSDIKQSDFGTALRGGFVRSNKESITIRTRLCSTKLTQNGTCPLFAPHLTLSIKPDTHFSASDATTQLEVEP